MSNRILGCYIDFRAYDDAKSAVYGSIGDSIMLGAVCRVTGVDASSVQNWVKRGYICKTDGKKYSVQQAAAVILLNNLRCSLELPAAAGLIEKAEKAGLSPADMLAVTASALIRAKRFNSVDREALKSVVNGELRDFGKFDRELSSAVLTVALSALAAEYKELAAGEAQSV